MISTTEQDDLPGPGDFCRAAREQAAGRQRHGDADARMRDRDGWRRRRRRSAVLRRLLRPERCRQRVTRLDDRVPRRLPDQRQLCEEVTPDRRDRQVEQLEQVHVVALHRLEQGGDREREADEQRQRLRDGGAGFSELREQRLDQRQVGRERALVTVQDRRRNPAEPVERAQRRRQLRLVVVEQRNGRRDVRQRARRPCRGSSASSPASRFSEAVASSNSCFCSFEAADERCQPVQQVARRADAAVQRLVRPRS